MNWNLNNLPNRDSKPRDNGLTMVMDKGLSINEVTNMIEAAGPYIDLVKLGFGSSLITPNLDKKISTYKSNGMPLYFGGTLFEAFIARNKFEDYQRYLDKYKMEWAEVSDGSITLPHSEKCEYIRKLSQQVRVISEVGSKEEGLIIHPNKWVNMMQSELDAGVYKVIAEARESGTVGIYRPSGKAHVVLINRIISKVPAEKIIWESPQKSQQTYFIKLFGANVNLGNIAPNEVIALESLRLGLRSDTFFQYINQ